MDEHQDTNGLIFETSLSGNRAPITALQWMPHKDILVTASEEGCIRFWNPQSGEETRQLWSNRSGITALCLAPDGEHIIIATKHDDMLYILSAESGEEIISFPQHHDRINAIAAASVGDAFVSASDDTTLKVWDLSTGYRPIQLNGHIGAVNGAAITSDNAHVASVSDDGTLRIWGIEDGNNEQTIVAHHERATAVAAMPDDPLVATASADCTIRIWNIDTHYLHQTIEGHTGPVTTLAFSPNGELLASRGLDATLVLRRTDTWTVVASVQGQRTAGQPKPAHQIAFHPTRPYLAITSEDDLSIDLYQLDYAKLFAVEADADTVKYQTAKVALVGESGVGKTALGYRMVYDEFRETYSTHGQQFWVMDRLKNASTKTIEREVVLWDFAGQPDYRIIHSLFLDDVDLALLLFDSGERYDVFKNVEYWANQFDTVKRETPVRKILVGARADVGSPIYSDNELKNVCEYFDIGGGYVSTSAMTGFGVDRLMKRVETQIDWGKIAPTVTTRAFHAIKSFVLDLKADPLYSHRLVTPKGLRELMKHAGYPANFADDTLMTAIRHLKNHGYINIVRDREGTAYILLQPELLINLAASFVLAARNNEQGLGALDEAKLLGGGYAFGELAALADNERDVLLYATTATLLEHHICFRESLRDVDATQPALRSWLIFPSLINQKPPYFKDLQLIDDVHYRVFGAVENIYASLVVKLGYSAKFRRIWRWQNGAQFDFGGDMCGFRVEETGDGAVELILFYGTQTDTPVREMFKSMFEKFLAQAEQNQTINLKRYPVKRCPVCDERQDQAVVNQRIRKQAAYMHCVACGTKIDLRADIGQQQPAPYYADELREVHQHVRKKTLFEVALLGIRSQHKDLMPSRVWVSYAMGNAHHDLWVLRLIKGLEEAGFLVVADRPVPFGEQAVGKSQENLLHQMAAAESLVVVGTPQYLHKLETQDPSMGNYVAPEVQLINQRLAAPASGRLFPILLEGDAQTALPAPLHDLTVFDFREEWFYFARLFALVVKLYNIPRGDAFISNLQALLSD